MIVRAASSSWACTYLQAGRCRTTETSGGSSKQVRACTSPPSCGFTCFLSPSHFASPLAIVPYHILRSFSHCTTLVVHSNEPQDPISSLRHLPHWPLSSLSPRMPSSESEPERISAPLSCSSYVASQFMSIQPAGCLSMQVPFAHAWWRSLVQVVQSRHVGRPVADHQIGALPVEV